MGNLYFEPKLDDNEYGPRNPIEVEERDLANLEGSICTYRKGNGDVLHDIQLDLDVPHEYRPSTTAGHGHLVIRCKHGWTTKDYLDLLKQLNKMGVIEQGFLKLLNDQGQTFLRLPEVKKGDTAAIKARVEAAKLRTEEVVAQEQRDKLLRDLSRLEGLG